MPTIPHIVLSAFFLAPVTPHQLMMRRPNRFVQALVAKLPREAIRLDFTFSFNV
jgi:hypothetical protein